MRRRGADATIPPIVALRDRQKRNLLATLLLSLGVPMLLAGDEFGRSQQGNNNAYCQDNDITWLDWHRVRPEDEALRRFVRTLVHLRRRHRVFSRPRFFRGEVVSAEGLKDITWVTQAGVEATSEDWGNTFALTLGYVWAAPPASSTPRAASAISTRVFSS